MADQDRNQNQDQPQDQTEEKKQQEDQGGPVYHDINSGMGEEEEGQTEEPAV